jgi:trans-aconitate 2-methyltransferase
MLTNDSAPREWDARRYHTLSEPQFEWGKRVLSTLDLRGDELVMDAGCGTGRLTTLVAERLPNGVVIAVDRSANMVNVAAETLARFGDAAPVVLADLSALPFHGAFDVVFSTATFHWVLDHARLFASIHDALKPSGRLHAQCGGAANLHRIHERVSELIHTSEFAANFVGWRDPWEFPGGEETRRRLAATGFTDVYAELEPAPVVFSNAESYAAFVSTVVLRPFLARLSDERLRNSFVERITNAAAKDNPAYELDYVRLNVRARRAG